MTLKKHIIILLLLLSASLAMAQGDANVQLSKAQKTYDDQRTVSQTFNIEYIDWYTLRNNPAFHHYFSQESVNIIEFKNLKDKNSMEASFSTSNTKGEYLFYEGDKQTKGSARASGKMVIDGVGTLFGTASYTNENKKNTMLNYAVNPLNYYPYLVSDTLGMGNQKYETYYVDGGFGFTHRGMYYGVGVTYQGIASSKLTDPRLSIYDSWFKLDFGITKSFKKHLLAAKVYPEFNRQKIAASSSLFEAPSVMQFNGFGTWKATEVKSTQSYDRLLTVNGYGMELTYKRLKEKEDDLGYDFSLKYNHRKMNTEDNSQLGFESNTKLNLFSRNTHHISPSISFNKKLSKVNLTVLLAGNNEISKGTEHIYNSQKVSGEQNLYDYIKVASNQFYTQQNFVNSASFKLVYPTSAANAYHVLARIQHQHYQEKYVFPNKKIENVSLSPSLGIGYNSSFKKNNVAFNLVYTQQFALSNSYDVPNVMNWINIQQSYIPFLIRGEEHYKIESELLYTHSLDNIQSIGAKLDVAYIKRNASTKSENLVTYISERSRSIFAFDFKLFYLF